MHFCGHLLRGGVDWNCADRKDNHSHHRHLLRGGVDWNYKNLIQEEVDFCHLLRGGVDWNALHPGDKKAVSVTSYAEVWIEIVCLKEIHLKCWVTSYAEVWIEMMNLHKKSCIGLVTSYAEVWIEICIWDDVLYWCNVTSYAEVWIEMLIRLMNNQYLKVTSYAEVWIEIHYLSSWYLQDGGHLLRGGVDWNIIFPRASNRHSKSPPTRRCGLKCWKH